MWFRQRAWCRCGQEQQLQFLEGPAGIEWSSQGSGTTYGVDCREKRKPLEVGGETTVEGCRREPGIWELWLFLFYFRFNYLRSVLLACMSVHYLCAWCQWRSEEVVRVPGTGVVAGCEPPRGQLGTVPRSSASSTSDLNSRTIFPALELWLLWQILVQMPG